MTKGKEDEQCFFHHTYLLSMAMGLASKATVFHSIRNFFEARK